jgi:hypothetical protein
MIELPAKLYIYICKYIHIWTVFVLRLVKFLHVQYLQVMYPLQNHPLYPWVLQRYQLQESPEG